MKKKRCVTHKNIIDICLGIKLHTHIYICYKNLIISINIY